MLTFRNAQELVEALSPDQPVMLHRPHAARRAARYFGDNFPGRSFYAVKANPSQALLNTLWKEGICCFDVASLQEVRLVSSELPGSVIGFMHPIKSEAAIREAYFQHGVRIFALDSLTELEKIISATGHAKDLILCVRIKVPSEFAEISLAHKFGADPDIAAELLQKARQHCEQLGICFHVGSQSMTPVAFVQGFDRARAAIVKAAVTVDIINVGGGFPSLYPDLQPPSLKHYFDVISRSFEDLPISYSAELWCEPGRALSAEYSSLIVRVEDRRDDVLYINDGAFGSLFDAAHLDWRFPVRYLRGEADSRHVTEHRDFAFFGPTCDDMDFMKGPFALPGDITVGDYIEIGILGAYGAAMQSRFNGMGHCLSAEARDEPMDSLYRGKNLDRHDRDNVFSITKT